MYVKAKISRVSSVTDKCTCSNGMRTVIVAV